MQKLTDYASRVTTALYNRRGKAASSASAASLLHTPYARSHVKEAIFPK